MIARRAPFFNKRLKQIVFPEDLMVDDGRAVKEAALHPTGSFAWGSNILVGTFKPETQMFFVGSEENLSGK